jgi:hypothetical protein
MDRVPFAWSAWAKPSSKMRRCPWLRATPITRTLRSVSPLKSGSLQLSRSFVEEQPVSHVTRRTSAAGPSW